jgi:hypothetical protein
MPILLAVSPVLTAGTPAADASCAFSCLHYPQAPALVKCLNVTDVTCTDYPSVGSPDVWAWGTTKDVWSNETSEVKQEKCCVSARSSSAFSKLLWCNVFWLRAAVLYAVQCLLSLHVLKTVFKNIALHCIQCEDACIDHIQCSAGLCAFHAHRCVAQDQQGTDYDTKMGQ